MNKIDNELIKVSRDCDAILIPGGEKVVLVEGTHVRITQALGGDYTVYVNGNLLKVSGKDSDAIGIKNESSNQNISEDYDEVNEEHVWKVLKTCYDPEIPVNIGDLGLIYDMKLDENVEGVTINIKMTLTAPGCGMGPVIANEAKTRVEVIPDVSKAIVNIVFDPPWDQSMVSDVAKLQLGIL